MAMLGDLLGFLFRGLVIWLLRLLLFPVVLILGTPFILIHAGVLTARGQARFRDVVVDDYSTIDVYWWQ